MAICTSAGVGALLLALAATAAAAQSAPQPPGSPQRGRELAERLCSTCHVVGSATSGTVRADVPSFHAIAGRTGVTAERLAGAVIVPHPAMPGVQLTVAEIRDVVAYILSLEPRK